MNFCFQICDRLFCSRDRYQKNKQLRTLFLIVYRKNIWRRHPDLNRGSGFCRPVPYHLAIAPNIKWSGWRGSNPLPPPWQGGALPDELHPHFWCLRTESNHRHGDFQSPALPTELQRRWRSGWDSNPRPLPWQGSVLTNWTTRPIWWELQGSNLWPSACKADALPAELRSHALLVVSVKWNSSDLIIMQSWIKTHYKRPRRDSNPWPPPWQGGALTNWATRP